MPRFFTGDFNAGQSPGLCDSSGEPSGKLSDALQSSSTALAFDGLNVAQWRILEGCAKTPWSWKLEQVSQHRFQPS